MRRVDFISPELDSNVIPYGLFEDEELITNKYWKMPLRRGFTEISKLFEVCKKHGAYICGGYARYCASGNTNGIEPSKDIDIFSKDMDSYNALVGFFDAIFENALQKGSMTRFESPYAISYDLPKNLPNTEFDANPIIRNSIRLTISEIFPIQIIKPSNLSGLPTSGDVFSILKSFDLSICQAAIISPTEVLVSKHFKNLEHEGVMVLANIQNPFMTLDRIVKYSNKKYKIKGHQLKPLLTYYNEPAKLTDIDKDQVEYMSRKGQS
jgi:hypothetical protein